MAFKFAANERETSPDLAHHSAQWADSGLRCKQFRIEQRTGGRMDERKQLGFVRRLQTVSNLAPRTF